MSGRVVGEKQALRPYLTSIVVLCFSTTEISMQRQTDGGTPDCLFFRPLTHEKMHSDRMKSPEVIGHEN